jgi:hypothetical protein
MNTHYAVVVDATVIGSRSSASRHIGGAGKFAPYTHACVSRVGAQLDVLSYHGTEALAAAAVRAPKWGAPAGASLLVAPVVITAKRLPVGTDL